MSEDFSNLSNTQLDQQISATTSAIESTTGQKVDGNETPREDIFANASDAKLTKELEAVWNRAEAREDRKPTPPPGKEGQTLSEAFDATADFMALPKSEQRLQSDAAEALAETKEIAERYGLTLEQAEAFKQTELLKQNSEFGPIADDLKAVFKDAPPQESARYFRQTAEAFRQDPIGTLAHLGGQAGLHPMQLAQLIAQRFGGQQPQQQHFSEQAFAQQLAHVEAVIDDFGKSNPQLYDYEAEITQVLETDQFQRSTLSPQQKLKAAMDVVQQRESKLPSEDKLDRSIRRAYDKAQKRRG